MKTATAPKATTANKTTGKKGATGTKKATAKADAPKAEETPAPTPEVPVKPLFETAVSDTIVKVDPRNVSVVEGFNVRKNMGDLEGLKNLIKRNGQLTPIVAVKNEDGTYSLVDGHRRLAAIMELMAEKDSKINTIDVREFTGSEADKVAMMLITGTAQKQLSEVERAEAVNRLHNEMKWTKEEIEGKLGISKAHLYNLLSMLKFSPELKALINEGKTTATTVLHITRREKKAKVQLEIAMQAIKTEERRAKALGQEPKAVTAKNIDAVKPVSLEALLNRVFVDLPLKLESGADNKGYKLLQALVDGERTPEALAKLFTF